MSRFATIDVGTNTVLLLVAERGEGGSFTAVDERMELTRLGRGVDRTRRLDPASVDATIAALRSFADAAREAGAQDLVVTATSAARDAENGASFFERGAEAAGVPIEVISGDREAELTYASARHDFGGASPLAVTDIGGGSTELVYGSGDAISFRHSFDVGSVRLTERWLSSDPPAPRELDALRRDLAQVLAAAPPPPPGASLVGIAGTVTTLCALHLGLSAYDGALVHGARLGRDEVFALAHRLGALPLADRLQIPGLPPQRADVIVAGAELLSALMEHLGFDEVIVSDRGIRWGLLYQRFGRPETP